MKRFASQQSFDLTGTTTRETLWTIVNAMQRCDPLYCAAHQQEPCSDAEWDAALTLAENELERLGLPPHPEV